MLNDEYFPEYRWLIIKADFTFSKKVERTN